MNPSAESQEALGSESLTCSMTALSWERVPATPRESPTHREPHGLSLVPPQLSCGETQAPRTHPRLRAGRGAATPADSLASTLQVAVVTKGRPHSRSPRRAARPAASLLLQRSVHTCRFSWTRSASLLAKAVSKMPLCSLRAALDCPRPISFPLSCSKSRANFLFDSSRHFIFLLKPLDSCS